MCQVKELKIGKKCCTPTDPIAIYIAQKDGGQIGLCAKCWAKIANTDFEVGDDPKPEDFQLWLSEGRGEEGTTLTEFKYHDKKGFTEKQEETDDE